MAKALARSKKKKTSAKKSPMKRTVRKVTLRHGSGLVGKKKLVKKIAKKATKKLIRAASRKKPAMAGVVGKVVHYYDRIGVAIVELTGPVLVGDILIFRRGKREFIQPVSSMQINHLPVEKAGKGKVVGIKVVQVADPGTIVLHG